MTEKKNGAFGRVSWKSIRPGSGLLPTFASWRLATEKVAGKWGYISSDGAIRIAPQFDEVLDFSSGLAPASIGGKLGYISQSGQWIIPAQFVVVHSLGNPMAGNFQGGLALLVVRNGSGERDLSMEYIDKKGKVVFGPAHMTGL
jgi:hypothetical protein